MRSLSLKKRASAAELMLGVLRIYDRITLVGQKSQGAGKFKNIISSKDVIPSEAGRWNIELVTSLFYLSDGSTFDNEGLRPDYEILDNEQALSSAVDILIERRQ